MLKSLIKGTSSILAFKVSSAAFSFLTNILVSRIYGTEVFGEYSLFFSMLNILVLANIVGLDLYLIKIVNELKSKDLIRSFISKSVYILIVLGFIILILNGLISGFINDEFFEGNRLYLVVFLGLAIPLFSIIKFVGAIFRAHGDVIYFSIMDGLIFQLPVFSIFSIFYLFGITSVHPTWILFGGLALGSTLSILLGFNFVKKKYEDVNLEIEYGDKILINSLPMMLTSSIIYLMAYLDTFFISDLLDNYQVGLYSGIVRLSLPLTFLSGALSGYIAPKISMAFGNNEIDIVRKLYKNSILLLFGVGMLVILFYFIFPKEILGIFGEQYKSEVTAFRIYTLSSFISGALFGPIGYFLVLTNHQKEFVVILIFSLLINVVLNYLLIPKYGISGAAIAIFIATFIWKLIGFLLLKYKRVL